MGKRKIFVLDTLKIVNIDYHLICPSLLEVLNGKEEYRDTVMKEHLYSVETLDEEWLNKKATRQMQHITDACKKEDAAYFRLFRP